MTGRPSATGAPRPHPDHEPGSDPPPAKGWMPQREDCPRGSVREEQTTVIRGAQSDRVENALITDELLTIAQAADWLGTSVRFPRRLITERRITFVRVGRHVRIPAGRDLGCLDPGADGPDGACERQRGDGLPAPDGDPGPRDRGLTRRHGPGAEAGQFSQLGAR